MKNKKKLISKIIILLIISVICLLGELFIVKNRTDVNENVDSDIAENNIQDGTNENMIASTVEQHKVDNKQQLETSQVNTSKTNDSKNKTSTVTKQQTQTSTSIQTQKQQTQTNTLVQPQEQQTETSTPVQTKEQQTQTSTPVQIQKEQSTTSTHQKQTTTTQTQTKTKKAEGEKFVKNDTMIEKIIDVIDNNKSENMKKYGYSIKVDPSIRTKTDQFTFTKFRVLNLIKHSFGTISVYAEDYYNNGQFIMTECYIF